jgi:agmatinase
MENFNPDGTGVDNGNYFGLPWAADEAALVLLSVPWDVTSSYGDGAARAPEAIIAASTQLDLFDPVSPEAWRRGIGTLPVDMSIKKESGLRREDARRVMRSLEKGAAADPELVAKVNRASEWLNGRVYDTAREWLDRGRLVGLVGGDHSTPYGLIRAVGEHEGALSVLHIDAHADLREAYEGFEHSHASIMFNVLRNVPQVERLVQVAVRDQSGAEAALAATDRRVVQLGDWELAQNTFRGISWDEQCGRIVEQLGEKVYISFDIDGLSPEFAPGTGTPVPGGLSFNMAVYLLDRIVLSGRRVVGFDLCEVAPREDDEWDANVGARVLWKLCGLSLKKI